MHIQSVLSMSALKMQNTDPERVCIEPLISVCGLNPVQSGLNAVLVDMPFT